MAGVVRDITERKQPEQSVDQASLYARSLLEASLDPLVTIGRDGKITDVNAATELLTGCTRPQLIGTDFCDYFTDAEKARTAYLQAFQEGFVRDFPLQLCHRDGHSTPVLYNASVYRDAAGEVVGVFAAARDITQLLRAENEIRMLAQLQSMVADLGLKALRSHRTENVLAEAVEMAAHSLRVEICEVLELLPDGKAFLLREAVGWPQELIGQAIAGVGADSQAGYTVRSNRPVLVDDLRREKRFFVPQLFLDRKIVSGMSVVIATGEGPYGVLSAYSTSSRIFSSDEVNCLQTVAYVLSSVVQRNRAEKQLGRLNQVQRVLSKCNHSLIRATDEANLLQEICDTIIEEAGYRFCWVGRAENDAAKSVRAVARAGFEAGYLESVNITWADNERGRGPTGTCIRTQKTVIARRIATDPTMAPWRGEAVKRGYASSVAIPLVVDAKIFGSLTIYSLDADAFGPEEVELLTELANDLAFGTGALWTRDERVKAEKELRMLNAELEQRVRARTAELQAANELKDEFIARERATAMELEKSRDREAAVGFRIQQNLLLDQPPNDLRGMDIAALTLPSQRIDGDFYIFIKHPGDLLDVVVGDVMGKGIPAALLGAATKSHVLKALSKLVVLTRGGTLPEPREIVMLAHAELVPHLIALESFVTLCYTRFDLKRKLLELVNCGHTGAIHWHRQSGACEVLLGDNLPLGVRADENYKQVSVPFEPQDLLLLYSDGITESRNSAGELFTAERLVEYVRENAQLEPARLVGLIRDEVLRFSQPAPLKDDLTAVAIRIGEPQVPLMTREITISSDTDQLPRAREFVRIFCRDLPGTSLDPDDTAALELAVCEATSNIMKHAYHGRAGQWIQIEGTAFPDSVLIQLRHRGDAFDPATVCEPCFNGSRESGFGTYIISSCVDEARYYADEQGNNCVSLRKSRKPQREGKP